VKESICVHDFAFDELQTIRRASARTWELSLRRACCVASRFTSKRKPSGLPSPPPRSRTLPV